MRASGEAGGLLGAVEEIAQRKRSGNAGLHPLQDWQTPFLLLRPSSAPKCQPWSPSTAPGWPGALSNPSRPHPSEGVWRPPLSCEGPWGVRISLPILRHLCPCHAVCALPCLGCSAALCLWFPLSLPATLVWASLAQAPFAFP